MKQILRHQVGAQIFFACFSAVIGLLILVDPHPPETEYTYTFAFIHLVLAPISALALTFIIRNTDLVQQWLNEVDKLNEK